MRILLTAGPTREPIDPVRFISNYSTGAMGYAIAAAAKKRAHGITLISGPTYLKPPKGIKTVFVGTAGEMFKAVKNDFAKSDCLIMAAAVSDFRPAPCQRNKIKRTGGTKGIRLLKNADILSWAGGRKGGRILTGFCMETEDLLSNAKEKLRSKNLDIIAANRIDRKKSAFGAGKTSVIILGPGTQKARLTSVSKERIARILLDKIEALWYKKQLKGSKVKKFKGFKS